MEWLEDKSFTCLGSIFTNFLHIQVGKVLGSSLLLFMVIHLRGTNQAVAILPFNTKIFLNNSPGTVPLYEDLSFGCGIPEL